MFQYIRVPIRSSTEWWICHMYFTDQPPWKIPEVSCLHHRFFPVNFFYIKSTGDFCCYQREFPQPENLQPNTELSRNSLLKIRTKPYDAAILNFTYCKVMGRLSRSTYLCTLSIFHSNSHSPKKHTLASTNYTKNVISSNPDPKKVPSWGGFE